MSTRTSNQTKARRAANDDIEQFLADHHDEVDAKLAAARKSIARGRAKPLEPLPKLQRDARRRAKPAR